jgi:S-adenosylmethionine-dependent methyltransferase
MPCHTDLGLARLDTVAVMTGDASFEVFEHNALAWHAWQKTPWGRLRYRIVAETLSRVCLSLGDRPLRVLDVGSGNGGDALPLAVLGHDVTLLDYSAALLDEAREDARVLGVGARLHTVHADLAEIANQQLVNFDLVLCHNVIQYRSDLAASVGTVCSAVVPGGAVSLIAVNPVSEVLLAAIRREDPVQALAMLDTETMATVTFGHDVRAVTVAQARVALGAEGCEVSDRFGIRCVTDYVLADDRKSDPEFYADLEQLELTLCDRAEFMGTARMWQLVGRKG